MIRVTAGISVGFLAFRLRCLGWFKGRGGGEKGRGVLLVDLRLRDVANLGVVLGASAAVCITF